MEEFQGDVLARQTPCAFADRERVLQALAEVHVEFVEGNGRMARMVTSLMAHQSGRRIVFDSIKGQRKNDYFVQFRWG